MPALGAVDPADLRAQARAELGLSHELAQPRRVKPHPREGGSSGYPVWSREEQLEKWNAGEETAASEASLYRWGGSASRLLPSAALIVILPIVGRMCTAAAATADAAAVYDVEYSTARVGAIR